MMDCAERQELLDQLRAALEELGSVVREARALARRAGSGGVAVADRSAEASAACERIWAELQQHQAAHKCWR